MCIFQCMNVVPTYLAVCCFLVALCYLFIVVSFFLHGLHLCCFFSTRYSFTSFSFGENFF